MSLSVREIIKEACTRINLVPRKQAVPGDILENGYKLLKGVADKYNKERFIPKPKKEEKKPVEPKEVDENKTSGGEESSNLSSETPLK